MVTYPISVRRDSYRGSNANRRLKANERNRIAAILESVINEMLKAQKRPVRTYSYMGISQKAGIDIETVRDLCFSVDCGSNGFTAIRQGLTLDEALDLAQQGRE